MKIKNVNDYVDLIHQLYPEVLKSDIKKILVHGLKQFYYLNSCGGDICLTDNNEFWMYSGQLSYDSLRHCKNYKFKLTNKLRIMSKRRKIPWDGFYYFALTDDQYQNYLGQIAKRGRPKKKFNYGNVMLYKLYDECYLNDFHKKYIFRVSYLEEFGFRKYYLNYISEKAELIEKREAPLKFVDVLTSNHKYQCLNGTGNS